MKDSSKKSGDFIVCGASSGFGRAVTDKLLKDNHRVLAVARSEEKLKEMKVAFPDLLDYIAGDLKEKSTLDALVNHSQERYLNGIFINSGGPPAKKISETHMSDWDAAYQSLLRWKVELTKRLLPKFESQGYGRILFLESSSVKQPIENLVLSTSLRLAVVGFAKTLSEEIAHKGVTVNILAPGFHDTAALNRLVQKQVDERGVSREDVFHQFKKQSKVGKLGNPSDLASLVSWILSDDAGFITGQTLSVDGGVIKGVFG